MGQVVNGCGSGIWGSSGEGENGDAQGAAESERRSSAVAMTHTGGNDEDHVQVCRGEM